MSEDTELTADAVSLLLELLEQDYPLISAGAADLRADSVARLEQAGLLVPYEDELIVTDIGDHEDTPIAVTWSHERGALTYFSPSGVTVAVPKERVQTRRVEILRVLEALSRDWDVPDRRPPFALVGNVLWEISDARLARRPRMPMWFARQLWRQEIRQQVVTMAKARPGPMPRVIVTSTAASRIMDLDIPGAVVVSIADVLIRPTSLMIPAPMLDARLRGVPVTAPTRPFVLSPDGRQLTIRGGPEVRFRARGQIAVIKKLIEGYDSGRRFLTADLLKIASSDVGSLQRFFGAEKWRQLSPYLKQVSRRWGFEL